MALSKFICTNIVLNLTLNLVCFIIGVFLYMSNLEQTIDVIKVETSLWEKGPIVNVIST